MDEKQNIQGTDGPARERGDSAADIIRKMGGNPEDNPLLAQGDDEEIKEKKAISKPGTITTKGKKK